LGFDRVALHGARLVKFVFALLSLIVLAPIAHAAEKGDCGTIILPTGGGTGPAADVTSFSPLYSDSAYNEESSLLLFPSLLWINRFSQIDWSRSLAASVTTTDNMNFLITMRPWHWSDGVPVTAGDVAYSFALDKQAGPTWSGYGIGGLPGIVKSIKVLNPKQLLLTTTHPVNPTWFIYNGISQLSPLPEHVWKKYTLDQMFQLQSTPSFYNVVDGPLKIQRLDMGLDAVFVPNPAWEGPKMHFSRLVFTFLEGDGASVQGVEAGDMDAGELPTDLFNAVKNFPGVHVEVLPQEVYQNVIYFNFRNPNVAFFRDVRVRQAMIDSIDQDAIVKQLEHGAGDAAYGPVPHSFTNFLTPAMKKGIYPVGYDPAKARALLAAAGYRPGPDGIMVKDGKRLSFTYLEESGTDAVTELDEILQADFRSVGIEMKIRIMEFNQLIALLDGGSPTAWEATGVGFAIQNYPSGEWQFATGGYENSGGYSDPVMDKLIAESTDKPGIGNLYAYETYVSAQQPVLFTPRERPVVLVSDRLHGYNDFINPMDEFAPDQLYCTTPSGEPRG
jgi:peptide/nickel transport system substrate-binding protein